MKKILFAFLAVLLLWAGSAWAATVTSSPGSNTANAMYVVGDVYVTGATGGYNYLYIGKDSTYAVNTGIIFPSVSIPPGSTITAASITFYAYAESTTTCSVTIAAENTAAPASTYASQSDFTTRYGNLTSASVSWSNIGAWSGSYAAYTSPDITSVIQAVVNLSGWASGNNIDIFLMNNGSSTNAYRKFEIYGNGSTNYLPVLSITYTSNILAAPTFEYASSGSYTANNNFTEQISFPSGSTLCYTTDGSTPTESGNSCTHGTSYSSSPASISMSASITQLKALTTESGYTDSSIVTANYTWTCANPTASLSAGTYLTGTTITLSDGTTGASIYYSWSSSPACGAGTLFSTPITGQTGTLYYTACLSNYNSASSNTAYTVRNAQTWNIGPTQTYTSFTALTAAQTLLPGDIVDGGGNLFRETWTIPSSGTVGVPITFQNATVSAANVITGWTNYSGNVWQATGSVQPSVVAYNGTIGAVQTSAANCTAVGNWYWASNVLYLYAPSNPGTLYANPGVEAGTRSLAIATSNLSNLIFQNLTTQFAATTYSGAANGEGLQLAVTSGNTISNITVQNVTSQYNGWDGFMVTCGSGTGNATNIQFINTTSQYNGRAGYHVFNVNATNANPITYHKCRSFYNAQLVDHHGFSSSGSTYIKRYNCESAYTGINPNTGKANQYYSDEGIGFAWDNGTSYSLDYANYSHNNAGYGMQAGNASSYNTDEYNLIVNNGNSNMIIFGNGGSSHISLLNNTVYGSQDGLDISSTTTGSTITIKNNIFLNSTGWGINNFSGSTVSASNNLFNNNGYTTTGVTSTNEIDANPLFTNGSGSYSVPTDFTLAAGSPAINAGTNVSLTTDYFNNPVVPGFVTIGAAQYQPQPVAGVTE
jgi:hypothetical protein